MLDLAGTAFTSEPLLEALSLHCSQLREIRVARMTNQTLTVLLTRLPQLQTLCVVGKNNSLSLQGVYNVKPLPSALKYLIVNHASNIDGLSVVFGRQLIYLDLSYCNIHITALDNILQRCQQLQFLSIRGCKSLGIQLLAAFRSCGPQLKYLDISETHMLEHSIQFAPTLPITTLIMQNSVWLSSSSFALLLAACPLVTDIDFSGSARLDDAGIGKDDWIV